MSAKGQEDPGEDLTSRVGAESPCSDMKRAAAKKLIERYFYQLTDGCGNPECDNQNCASSGKVTNLTPNQAAAQAIQLFSQEARLCDGTQPNKVARTTIEPGPASLAKSLPVKSVNPTCSDEGIASNFDKTNKGFEVVASNVLVFPRDSVQSELNNCKVKETPCLCSGTSPEPQVAPENSQILSCDKSIAISPCARILRSRSSPQKKSSFSKIGNLSSNTKKSKSAQKTGTNNSKSSRKNSSVTKRKKIRVVRPHSNSAVVSRPDSIYHPNSSQMFLGESNSKVLSGDSRSVLIQGSRLASPVSNSTSSSGTILRVRPKGASSRKYAKSAPPRRTRYEGRLMQLNKPKCRSSLEKKSFGIKRVSNSRQVENRQSQKLVRKLVVLTLYLKYLKVKRSSHQTKYNKF